MNEELVSVVIPTHNRGGIIKNSLASVLNQTYSNIEIIVVDDGSTDNTADVVASFCDPRIRYVKLPECEGACNARNIGIGMSQGKFIAFNDSDDIWMNSKIEMQMKELEHSSADLTFCRFRRISLNDENSQVFPDSSLKPGFLSFNSLLYQSLISTQTIFGKKECFLKHKFDSKMPRLQDWDLMLRMINDFTVFYSGDVLVEVREQKDSISQDYKAGISALDMIYQKNVKGYNNNPLAYSQLNLTYSTVYEQGKQFFSSLKYCFKALSWHTTISRNAHIMVKAAKICGKKLFRR